MGILVCHIMTVTNTIGHIQVVRFLWNEWVHVAMSLFKTGSNNLKFYKNGQLMSSHTLNNTSPTDTAVMNIGRQSPSTCACNILDGNLDEVRIWSKPVRTQAEIQANKNSEL